MILTTPAPLQAILDTLTSFFTMCYDGFSQFLDFVVNDESKTMLTFVIAFPLCFIGVWIIKKLIRVKDTD